MTTGTVNQINIEQFKDAVFFSLTVRKPGNRAKVKDFGALEEYLTLLHADNNNGADVGQQSPAVDLPKNFKGKSDGTVKVTKRLLLGRKPTAEDPTPDPYVNTCAFLTEAKEKLTGRFGRALPSKIKEGLFVVRKELVQDFEDELNATLAKLQDEYIPQVRTEYPLAKERAKTTPVQQGGLGPLYREADYPPIADFLACFGLEWQWLALGVPDELPEALRAEAAAKLERQFTEAADEVKNALRESFAELIAHATDKLKPAAPGEKQPVFRDSLIGNIAQFIEVFQARNLMGDTQLENLVNQARSVLQGVEPGKLRKFANVRETTREQFAAIQAQLDSMITTRKGRVIDLEG